MVDATRTRTQIVLPQSKVKKGWENSMDDPWEDIWVSANPWTKSESSTTGYM
jgi:hypothetical protein